MDSSLYVFNENERIKRCQMAFTRPVINSLRAIRQITEGLVHMTSGTLKPDGACTMDFVGSSTGVLLPSAQSIYYTHTNGGPPAVECCAGVFDRQQYVYVISGRYVYHLYAGDHVDANTVICKMRANYPQYLHLGFMLEKGTITPANYMFNVEFIFGLTMCVYDLDFQSTSDSLPESLPSESSSGSSSLSTSAGPDAL